jgi:two-component sensor histidine kinase
MFELRSIIRIFCALFALLISQPVLAQNTDAEIKEQAILDSLVEYIYNQEWGKPVPIEKFTVYKSDALSYQNILNQHYNFSDLITFWLVNGNSLMGNEELLKKYELLGVKIENNLTTNDTFYIDYLNNIALAYRTLSALQKSDSINQIIINYSQNSTDKWIQNKGLSAAYINAGILHVFKSEFKDAIEDCKTALDYAKAINDSNQIIISTYFLAKCYNSNKEYDLFLKTAQEAYSLVTQVSFYSEYTYSVVELWLQGLLRDATEHEQIEAIIADLEQIPTLSAITANHKLIYLSKLKPEHPFVLKFQKEYSAGNVLELIELLNDKAKNELVPHDYTRFLTSSARALTNHGYAAQGLDYMNLALENVQEIYTQKMSQDLAKIEGEKVKREKDIEIAAEQAKNQIFLISTVAAILLAAVILIALINIRKQAQKLRIKNNEIENQRAALEKADGEKALLIKEIHHRVKNNFQVVSSLLELQSRGIEDIKAKELAQEGQNRVKSMALIHQRLYQNEDLLISFEEYTGALVNEIAAMYDKEVDADIKAENFAFDVDTAVPLGLILNELITNAFKYAINENHKSLKIHFEKLDDSYKMVVKDNGKGIDPNFDLKRTKSLGLKLVNRLSQQLKGKAEILNEEGAAFAIYFKDTEMRKRSN